MDDTRDIDLIKEQANELIEILEIMPDDVGTLNSLVHTFLELDNLPRAENYAMKLVVALDIAGDADMVQDYIQQYISIAPNSEMFRELIATASGESNQSTSFESQDSAEDLEFESTQPGTAGLPFIKGEPANPTAGNSFGIENIARDVDVELDEFTLELSAELELADFLKNKGLITEAQAEAAVATLIENRSLEHTFVPLTFLNELSLIQHVNMEKVISFLSKKESIPFIKVKQFNVSEDVRNTIPPLTAKKLGIVVFSSFKDELMMAISNPLNTELKQGLEEVLGKKIHFYLTSPSQITDYYNG